MSFEVREATSEDRLGVRRVLDAAMLDVRDDLGERIDAGDVLVATEERDGAGESIGARDAENRNATILGALVLVPRESGAHIDAVAVRRARRAQGVGTSLVRAAAERPIRLTAEFDPDVGPFYESLGFDISPVGCDGERLRGHRDGTGR
jgi:GNAT superfamily N-acetyltransferase